MALFLCLLATIPIILLLVYINMPLRYQPSSAQFDLQPIQNGYFQNLEIDQINNTYGVGLSYREHIIETAVEFSPHTPIPIFEKKSKPKIGNGYKVSLPGKEEIIHNVQALEPGLAEKLYNIFSHIPTMMDYEAELAFILLEDISPEQLLQTEFTPKLGFFIANDLSARSIAILGEGMPDRYPYWGSSKSFEGFLPISTKIWIPHQPKKNSLPDIVLQTKVNGIQKQNSPVSDMIYTPAQLLKTIAERYPNRTLSKGDVVLMGTPGGVAFHTPRWLYKLMRILKINRFTKLKLKAKGNQNIFLQEGDKVEVNGGELGSATVYISK